MDTTERYEPLQTACPYQCSDESGLHCERAKLINAQSVTQTSEDVCLECEIGRISRELGCREIGGSVHLLEYGGIGEEAETMLEECNAYCPLLKRRVDWDYCSACPHTHRPVVQEAIKEARGLLDRLGFAESATKLHSAQLAFQAGQTADTVLRAKAALESCLHSVLQRLKARPDSNADMGKLWQAVKKQPAIWNLPSSDAAKQIASGIVSIILGASTIRSRQTDAHGRDQTSEMSMSQVELVLNCVAALCLFLARRLDESEKQGKDGDGH